MLTIANFKSENDLVVFDQGKVVNDVKVQQTWPAEGLELELASDLLTLVLLSHRQIKIHKSIAGIFRRHSRLSSICTLKESSFITVRYSTYLKFGPGKAFARMVSVID
jgi:hypothetical protein